MVLVGRDNDDVLEVVEQTILEVLTPNQKQDKDNLKEIAQSQTQMMEDMANMKADIELVKKHLEVLTGETEPEV